MGQRDFTWIGWGKFKNKTKNGGEGAVVDYPSLISINNINMDRKGKWLLNTSTALLHHSVMTGWYLVRHANRIIKTAVHWNTGPGYLIKVTT